MHWRRELRVATAVGAACLFLFVTAFALTRHARDRLLHQEAVAAAVSWADYLAEQLPGIGDIFDGRGVRPADLKVLSRAQSVGDIFLYKFFDPEGRLQLSSATLDSADRLTLHRHQPNKTLAQQILDGRVFVELKSGTDSTRPKIYSEAYVPVERLGRLRGVIEVYVDQTERAAYFQQVFNVLITILIAAMGLIGAATFVFITRGMRAQHRAEENVAYLARHDSLTGLLNRASFNEALADAIRENRAARTRSNLALILIDIDRFKDINDSLGPAAGDRLLRTVAERLEETRLFGDVIARIGGDEFVILRPEAKSRSTVESFVRGLTNVLNTVYDLEGQSVACAATVGVVVADGGGSDKAMLFKAADLAMHRAKADGPGGYRFYEPFMDADLHRRLEIEGELAKALDHDQFELYYQPQFELATGALRGYEALLRWHHPTRGMVPPCEFVPVAERSGMIADIGAWVLRRACCDAAGWPGDYTVAVNISPAQFKQSNLVETLRTALAISQLQPARLEIEVTESLLFQNAEQALDVLEKMKALGVRVAMDDFGTGFSSLSHLWKFPFDKIKIDQSFIRNIRDNEKVEQIVTSIIDLGSALGIAITAEGVEHAYQAEFLSRHNCEMVQGFLYGRPMPHGELTFADALAGATSRLAELAGQGAQHLDDTRPPERPGVQRDAARSLRQRR